jgi:hypothetical protein
VQEGKSGRSLTSLANWFDEAGTADEGPQLFHGLFEPAQPMSRCPSNPRYGYDHVFAIIRE